MSVNFSVKKNKNTPSRHFKNTELKKSCTNSGPHCNCIDRFFWWLSREKPYKIQEDLMRAIYTAIEDRKIGIFESPTGTGKSKWKYSTLQIFNCITHFATFRSINHVTACFFFLMIKFSTGNEFSTAWPAQFANNGKINRPFLLRNFIGGQLLTNWISSALHLSHLIRECLA